MIWRVILFLLLGCQFTHANILRGHILAAGQMVCTFDSTGSEVYEYYHADNLHSSSVMTDNTGAKVQHYEYSAYGQDRFTESTNAFPITRRYTSQKLDEDTGLYFYGSRYYDQNLARFIQADDELPELFDPQGLNRYSYVRNNPLKYTDPDGHWGQEVADWWAGTVNTGAGYITASPSHWVWNGTVGTVNNLAGGLASPLTLGSSAGAVSGNPNATAKDYAIATVVETANAAALVPVAAGAGKAVSTLVRAGEKEAVGELAGALGGCFLAGTLVPTESGNVEIQTVKVGDRVWSYSMQTGKWELRSVEATPVHDYAEDVVTIGAGNVAIEASGNHPFWVVSGDELASRPLATDVPENERASNPSGRWVEARSLRAGDALLLLNGETATITALSTRQAHVLVYNLRVENNHTYAVSQAGVLVHNKAAQVKPITSDAVDTLQGGKRLSNDRLSAAPSKRGNAPIGEDGKPVELHHRNQTSGGPLDEMTRTEHRGGENYSKNHSNTGQSPSQIDRNTFNKTRTEHWQNESDKGRFDNLPNK